MMQWEQQTKFHLTTTAHSEPVAMTAATAVVIAEPADAGLAIVHWLDVTHRQSDRLHPSVH